MDDVKKDIERLLEDKRKLSCHLLSNAIEKGGLKRRQDVFLKLECHSFKKCLDNMTNEQKVKELCLIHQGNAKEYDDLRRISNRIGNEKAPLQRIWRGQRDERLAKIENALAALEDKSETDQTLMNYEDLDEAKYLYSTDVKEDEATENLVYLIKAFITDAELANKKLAVAEDDLFEEKRKNDFLEGKISTLEEEIQVLENQSDEESSDTSSTEADSAEPNQIQNQNDRFLLSKDLELKCQELDAEKRKVDSLSRENEGLLSKLSNKDKEAAAEKCKAQEFQEKIQRLDAELKESKRKLCLKTEEILQVNKTVKTKVEELQKKLEDFEKKSSERSKQQNLDRRPQQVVLDERESKRPKLKEDSKDLEMLHNDIVTKVFTYARESGKFISLSSLLTLEPRPLLTKYDSINEDFIQKLKNKLMNQEKDLLQSLELERETSFNEAIAKVKKLMEMTHEMRESENITRASNVLQAINSDSN